MDRTAEIKAQIEAHNLTIKFINQQVAELEAELAQIEADRPKPFVLREITPEVEAKEAAAATEIKEIIEGTALVWSGVGQTRNGHGGQKATNTRRINKAMKKWDSLTLTRAFKVAEKEAADRWGGRSLEIAKGEVKDRLGL